MKDQKVFLCKWCGAELTPWENSKEWRHDGWIWCPKTRQGKKIEPVPDGCLMVLEWREE